MESLFEAIVQVIASIFEIVFGKLIDKRREKKRTDMTNRASDEKQWL